MKRLALYALRFFVLASALVCLAAVVMWVRSYRFADYYGRSLGPVRVEFDSAAGWPQMVLALDRVNNTDNDGWRSIRESPTPGQWAHGWIPRPNRFGFLFYAGRTRGSPNGNWVHGNRFIGVVWMPYWCIAAVTALAPTTAIAGRIFRRRRIVSGRCAKCGYDLRATPDRCPECGTIPTKVTA
jgi:hypothetical protein